MRFNEHQLHLISQEKPDYEDRLSYIQLNSNSPKNFKERWFRLKSNMLFYFKFTVSGQIECKAAGVIILEGSKLEYEEHGSAPFAFSLVFAGDYERRYIFSAKSEEAVEKWIHNLRLATYEYKRNHLLALRKSIALKRCGAPPLPPRITGSNCKSTFPGNYPKQNSSLHKEDLISFN
ncbi:pleckstrin homology domain-containing family J member 1-like [Cimex lectularius]|uniref:PH domain-containing protein n=1 Tax=Cimex lectularius TaxID=79782 RepID=A0A8I6R9G1_CIMLE|nr:pleckstrin homology domain-containing family J member 1-like [Cimex lectularius]